MRKSSLAITAFIFAASLATQTLAQPPAGSSVQYRWYDAHGLMHFSDSLSAEAMKFGYDVINAHGMVVRHVPRQLNAEERAAAIKLAAEKAARQRAAQETADADAQMLSAYPDEESYKISLQQQLEAIDQQIHTTRINLRSQEQALTDLLARAADLENAKDPVPKFITRQIAAQRAVVTEQRDTLKRQQALRAQTAHAQVQQLAHYRQLKAAEDKSSN